MRTAANGKVVLAAAALLLLACGRADGGYSVRSSKHFRIRYDNTKTKQAYARFILKETERAWKAIFTDLGYAQPAWMSDRVAKGGKIMLAVKKTKFLAIANTQYKRATKVAFNGTITFDYESRFKFKKGAKRGKINWDLLRATCGHELFHLVQGGYDPVESKWLKETTATWIEDKIFPAEAKANPNQYGHRFYMKAWNRHRRRVPLVSLGKNQEYAAAIFFQYITEHDPRGNGFVKSLWIEAGKTRGDTMAASLAKMFGDTSPWGAKTMKRIEGLSLTDLVRSSKRQKNYSLASFVKGPYFTPVFLPVRGVAIPGETDGQLRTASRKVAKLSFDCVNLVCDPLKIGSPVDVVLAARGDKDGAWAFHVVRAPKRRTWKVRPFAAPKGRNWTEYRARNVDFRTEKLYFVATRTSATSKDKYHLSGLVITPPVVEYFAVLTPPVRHPSNMPLGRTSAPKGPQMAWRLQRTAWTHPLGGTGWRTDVSPNTGIAYYEGDTARIRLAFNRPVAGRPTIKLGGKISPGLTPVGKSGRKFTAGVPVRSLKDFLASGKIPVEITATDRFGMGLDARPWTAPQLDFTGSKAPKLSAVRKWEGGQAAAVRPGGGDNFGGKTIPIYQPGKPRPRIASVKLSREVTSEIFYHSRDGNFRPMTPGRVRIEITFETAMDTEFWEVKHRNKVVAGRWKTPKMWVGTMDLPKGTQAFSSAKGIGQLSIQARTSQGTAIDTDPETDGDQPDTTHRIVTDGVVPYIESVKVYGDGGTFYQAAWSGGGDLRREPNLSAARIGDRRRKLNITTAKDLPAEPEGTVSVSVRSSQPLDSPPSILMGPVPVGRVTGKDPDKKLWTGEVSLEAVRAKVKPGEAIRIAITAKDAYGNNLDADPRTVSALATTPPWWRRYESQRGGTSSGRGGIDTWHEIGEPPRISFVIILDASGSMADDNRLVNAKKAITELLDEARQGDELALVIFQGGSTTPVGFTRDVARIREAAMKVSASGSTPLAAAVARARVLLESATHPMSYDWRYRIFSDGQETCGGNVVAEIRLLNAAIARRRGARPAPPKDKTPPPRPAVAEKIPCNPQRWTRHMVKVDSSASLDWIWLVEMTFVERELPDGRCMVRFEYRPYGVAYGSITDADGSNLKIKWQVNSRPSRGEVRRATSDDGKAAIDRIRRYAAQMKAKTKSMAQCRKEIQEHVEREVR